MTLSQALGLLRHELATPERLSSAFARATAARASWSVSDPLGYCDLGLCSADLLPAVSALSVDVIAKPKQGGGVRLELLPDVLTGTLLQLVADLLCERRLLSGPGPSAPFGQGACDGTLSYEVWLAGLTGWLRRHLGSGRAVIAFDIAAFFPSIAAAQIRAAITKSGVSTQLADAMDVVFAGMNAVVATPEGHAHGLPIMPDMVAWVIADAVLVGFDHAIQGEPGVHDYARWADDCFIACDHADMAQVLARAEAYAQEAGFRLNAGKTRAMGSVGDLDRIMMQREHNLLSDLFALAGRQSGASIDLQAALPQIVAHLDADAGSPGPVIKRLYALATLTGSSLLVERSTADLSGFPVAERAILTYLASLDWPSPSDRLLLGALAGEVYDSRPLIALRLLLQAGGQRLPAGAADQCRRIVGGDLPAHEVVRSLAFAVLADGASRDDGLVKGFAAALARMQSAMARRLGLQALVAGGLEDAIDWQCYADDPSALVLRLVQALSSTDGRRALAASLPPVPPRHGGWGAFRERLVGHLIGESQ